MLTIGRKGTAVAFRDLLTAAMNVLRWLRESHCRDSGSRSARMELREAIEKSLRWKINNGYVWSLFLLLLELARQLSSEFVQALRDRRATIINPNLRYLIFGTTLDDATLLIIISSTGTLRYLRECTYSKGLLLGNISFD